LDGDGRKGFASRRKELLTGLVDNPTRDRDQQPIRSPLKNHHAQRFMTVEWRRLGTGNGRRGTCAFLELKIALLVSLPLPRTATTSIFIVLFRTNAYSPAFLPDPPALFCLN
jgi:hypothetical protein